MSHRRLDAGGQAVWRKILDSTDEIHHLLGQAEVVNQLAISAFMYDISIVDAMSVC